MRPEPLILSFTVLHSFALNTGVVIPLFFSWSHSCSRSLFACGTLISQVLSFPPLTSLTNRLFFLVTYHPYLMTPTLCRQPFCISSTHILVVLTVLLPSLSIYRCLSQSHVTIVSTYTPSSVFRATHTLVLLRCYSVTSTLLSVSLSLF